MRKLGVRVVSAALAACMVASVLPVSAFAADGAGTAGAGTSTSVPADAQELPTNGSLIEAGKSYKISQDRSYRTVIDTDGDVTIYITANVNYSIVNNESVLDVKKVGKLTIVNDGYTVSTGSTFLFVRSDAANAEIKVEGGTYQCGEKTAFNIYHAGNVTLENVSAQSNDIVVAHNGTGTLTIDGGTYTGGSTSSALLNNSTGTMEIKGAPTVTGTNTAVVNKEGTLTIDGGTYISTKSAAVSNGINGTVTINGGSFTSDDKVLLNDGTMTIDQTAGAVTSIKNKSGLSGAVINSGTLGFNGGTVTAPNGSGIHSVARDSSTAAVTTNINGGTITGCNAGISLQAGNLTVNLNNGVTLSSNTHDIVLREKQKIGGTYTGTASVRVFDPTHVDDNYGRLLSTSLPAGLQLESHNPGYSVKEHNGQYYLHRNDLHNLYFSDAEAKADDGSESLKNLNNGDEVAAGTKVNLKANAPTDATKEFDKWVVKDASGNEITDLTGILDNANSSDAILTMPNDKVTVEATYKTKQHELTYKDATAKTEDGTDVASGDAVAVGTKVSLEANDPTDDTKEFDKWVVKDASGNEITGTELDNILTVDSSDPTKATLTMPNQAVTVEATYKTKQHELTYDKATATANGITVNAGDQVEVGTKVELKAEPAPVNKVFDKWEVRDANGDLIDDLTGILDVNGTDATLTMPNYPVKIEAKYKASENALTFDNATATVGGNNVNSGDQVAAGTNVSMKADLPEDEEFTGWTITVDGVDKTDELLGSTAGDPDISFTMPDGSVEVTANHTTKKNTLNYEDAAATVGGSTVNSGDPVAVGTKVDLKANDPTDDTKEFDHWEVTDANGNKITGDALDKILSDANSADTTLTMPNYEVTIKPVTRTKTNPGTDPSDPSDPGDPGTDPDDPATPSDPADTAVDPGCTIGGAIATVIVGGTAAWGVYEAGTGIYRMIYMPGIILPTTRAELAMLIWEKADKPEPESDVLFEDIDEDNTDLQKAARWMVEQDLMDEKDDNKFLPGAHVTKLRVCTTWNDAREKGLID